MADPEPTHFFTEHGVLCGARVTHRWSLVESSTTCEACRELLEAREQYESEAKARSLVALRKIPGEP